jgi:hypothetical protein
MTRLLAAVVVLLVAACERPRSAAEDRALFAANTVQIEELVSMLRQCPETTLTLDLETGAGRECSGRADALRARLAELGLKRAHLERGDPASAYVELVTSSVGLGCRTAIVWTDIASRISPEEYDPLTSPPTAWWWLNLKVC